MKKNKVLIIVFSLLLIVTILSVAMFKLNVLERVFDLKASITLAGQCSSGYTFNQKTYKCEKVYAPTNCPSGYSGSNCSKTYKATISTRYECPKGSTIVNLCRIVQTTISCPVISLTSTCLPCIIVLEIKLM